MAAPRDARVVYDCIMKKDPKIRLMAKCRVDEETGCWVWTAAKAGPEYKTPGRGYSAFYLDGRLTSGHRASYQLFKGPIPDGMTIDHLCRNTLCVNPDHLEVVTQGENTARGFSAGPNAARTGTCHRGHPYDEENTYVRPDGRGRDCRECRRAVMDEYWASHPRPKRSGL